MARIKDPLDLNPPALTPEEEAERAARAADTRPIWEIIAERAQEIPPEERAKVPHDGSINFRKYRREREANRV